MTKPKTTKQTDSPKEPKDVRYIRKHFGEDVRTFETKGAGFVPLPIVYRKLLRKISAPQLRVLIYLCTRASKHGLCYPTYEEIAHDLGLEGRRNLTPHIKALEEMRFISTRSSEGKKFYLIHDPEVVIEYFAGKGQLSGDDLDEINDLYEALHKQPLSMATLKARSQKKQQAQPKK